MSFYNDTNQGRINKIMDILALIDKSAKSNQVTPEQIFAYLERPINEIGRMSGMDTYPSEPVNNVPEPAPQKVSSNIQKPTWADVREMAETCPLKDLSVAMAVYMNRVDELLSD